MFLNNTYYVANLVVVAGVVLVEVDDVVVVVVDEVDVLVDVGVDVVSIKVEVVVDVVINIEVDVVGVEVDVVDLMAGTLVRDELSVVSSTLAHFWGSSIQFTLPRISANEFMPSFQLSISSTTSGWFVCVSMFGMSVTSVCV